MQGLANAAGLGTYDGLAVEWHAIGSTATVNANDPTRLPTSSSAGIYLNDGSSMVAMGGAGLWSGSILLPINRTETGGLSTARPWTGTNQNGSASSFSALGMTVVTNGDAAKADKQWIISNGIAHPQVGSSQPVYGYSDVLTVTGVQAVPEPGTLTLALVGLGGLVATRLARRRREADL